MPNNILTSVQNLSDHEWNRIGNNGTQSETTITDNLTDIFLETNTGNTSTIELQVDTKYKEAKTAADFVVVIRDSAGNQHWLAFQAKKGKANTKDTNMYSEIDHRIGNTGPYQMHEFATWSSENPTVESYYLFYNGDFDNFDLNFNTGLTINETSFFVELLDKVQKLSDDGKDICVINLSQLVNSNSTTHEELVALLRRKIN